MIHRRHTLFTPLLVAAILGGIGACDRTPSAGGGAASAPSGRDDGDLKRSAGPERAAARGLTPLPDCAGRIRHIVFHSADGLVGLAWRPVYDLLSALPGDTKFTFVCNSDAALAETRGRLRQWKFADRETIRTCRVPVPLLIWSRDRYIAMRGAAGENLPVWLVPRVVESFDSARRSEERRVPRLLNGFAPYCRIAETPLVLEGGNLIASGRHVFIGANVLRENAAAAERTREALEALFAPPVVLVADDSGLPPITHVDLFVTPIADDHVLVASPALAREIMATADAVSKQALARRLFITADMPDPKGPDFRPERAARFDQAAARLAGMGLRVTRIPYADSRGGDFIVTYNNVIQEHRDGHHVVYMPIYRIPALDAAATRAFESLGLVVRPIDVSPICHLLGAVRCLANVVERSQP